jgi:hypothetical protein
VQCIVIIALKCRNVEARANSQYCAPLERAARIRVIIATRSRAEVKVRVANDGRKRQRNLAHLGAAQRRSIVAPHTVLKMEEAVANTIGAVAARWQAVRLVQAQELVESKVAHSARCATRDVYCNFHSASIDRRFIYDDCTWRRLRFTTPLWWCEQLHVAQTSGARIDWSANEHASSAWITRSCLQRAAPARCFAPEAKRDEKLRVECKR